MPATLASLVANENGLRVFCDGCGRCVDLDVGVLIERYGPATELPEIRRRARCAACRRKGGSVQAVTRWQAG